MGVARDWTGVIPEASRRGYDVREVIRRIVDIGDFFEVKERFAPEIVIGLGRILGRSVGFVANQPMVKGGAIFVDSADKAARFISWCDAFNIPLIFLADVPGFMIGSAVEKRGIIRHGAKFIAAMSSAQVPRFTVVLRKAYAAGYYAMCCPGFEPNAVIALGTAEIAAMSPEAAVNAVFANQILEIDDVELRKSFIAERQKEYQQDLDIIKMASDLFIDAVISPESLRGELRARLEASDGWTRSPVHRHHLVSPV
jgi:acetyl-CoA carboxylase carboxyltransferase component